MDSWKGHSITTRRQWLAGNDVAKYTDLGKPEVYALADHYGLMLDGFKPIEGGARNSSYLLQSQQGEYVLTVFDDRSRTDVDKLGRQSQHVS